MVQTWDKRQECQQAGAQTPTLSTQHLKPSDWCQRWQEKVPFLSLTRLLNQATTTPGITSSSALGHPVRCSYGLLGKGVVKRRQTKLPRVWCTWHRWQRKDWRAEQRKRTFLNCGHSKRPTDLEFHPQQVPQGRPSGRLQLKKCLHLLKTSPMDINNYVNNSTQESETVAETGLRTALALALSLSKSL